MNKEYIFFVEKHWIANKAMSRFIFLLQLTYIIF